MRRRRISRGDVRNALRDPLGERPGTHELGGTLVIEGIARNGRRLHVVVEEENRERVVSAFWAEA